MDIILIAGMWLDGRAWDDVVPLLGQAGHHPVALTLPGQGGPHGDLDDQLAAVVTAIDAADGPVLVVGHSAAATLAWLAADRRPEKVARVALVGGFPAAGGARYFDPFAPVDGAVPFPGWDAFDGPDAADLTPALRQRLEKVAVPVAEGVALGAVHYENDRRRHVPVTLVCPEFGPDDARGWIDGGDLPELAHAQHLDLVDLDSGHWPMASQPQALATLLAGLADRPHLLAMPPWEPPLAGTDTEHLGATLDRLRATFRWKADGLDIGQLRRRIPSSRLSLGGLLKHLAVCEDDVFAWRILGERPETWSGVPEGTDPHEWMFDVADDDTAEGLYALYDDAVRRSRKRYAALVADGALDRPGALDVHGLRPNARRHVHDLVEEYGRHTGHADLLREAVDGRTGEDPDPSWTWDVLA